MWFTLKSDANREQEKLEEELAEAWLMSAGIKVGWGFFGLLVVLLFGYGLTRGIFVGSMTEYQASMGGFYTYNCRYLYPDGVRLKFGGGTGKSPDEAIISSSGVCPLLDR